MLTDTEFLEFVEAIQKPVDAIDVLLHGNIVVARAMAHTEAIRAVEAMLVFFKTKQESTND